MKGHWFYLTKGTYPSLITKHNPELFQLDQRSFEQRFFQVNHNRKLSLAKEVKDFFYYLPADEWYFLPASEPFQPVASLSTTVAEPAAEIATTNALLTDEDYAATAVASLSSEVGTLSTQPIDANASIAELSQQVATLTGLISTLQNADGETMSETTQAAVATMAAASTQITNDAPAARGELWDYSKPMFWLLVIIAASLLIIATLLLLGTFFLVRLWSTGRKKLDELENELEEVRHQAADEVNLKQELKQAQQRADSLTRKVLSLNKDKEVLADEVRTLQGQLHHARESDMSYYTEITTDMSQDQIDQIDLPVGARINYHLKKEDAETYGLDVIEILATVVESPPGQDRTYVSVANLKRPVQLSRKAIKSQLARIKDAREMGSTPHTVH
jgi:predicted  nucleic acid-binding Zn-ribbon protein